MTALQARPHKGQHYKGNESSRKSPYTRRSFRHSFRQRIIFDTTVIPTMYFINNCIRMRLSHNPKCLERNDALVYYVDVWSIGLNQFLPFDSVRLSKSCNPRDVSSKLSTISTVVLRTAFLNKQVLFLPSFYCVLTYVRGKGTRPQNSVLLLLVYKYWTVPRLEAA